MQVKVNFKSRGILNLAKEKGISSRDSQQPRGEGNSCGDADTAYSRPLLRVHRRRERQEQPVLPHQTDFQGAERLGSGRPRRIAGGQLRIPAYAQGNVQRFRGDKKRLTDDCRKCAIFVLND